MQKPEKEIKKPKESKKKHKRKVSVFTIFLWLFLITTMSTITIGSLNKKNAIEVTDNNWNIQLVMYDRSSDTPNQAITDFTWSPANEDETRQLTMQINYACTTGKEYQPGEIVVEIPGIAKDSFSEYWRNHYSIDSFWNVWLRDNIVITADKIDSSTKQYDWSYQYNEENNLYTFTNNMTVSENENFEGTIQIVYNLKPEFRIQTDLEYQTKIKENIESDEIIAIESNVCSFHYMGIKKTYEMWEKAYVAPRIDYTPIEDILDDYYWVKYAFNANYSTEGIVYALDTKGWQDIGTGYTGIKETLPDGCVMYDKDLNKVEPVEGNTYYYLDINYDSDYWYGDSFPSYYVGYPKSTFQEGDSITNTAELWGRYEDEEEIQKLAESSTTVSLVDFDFEYKGNLYSMRKDKYGTSSIYLNQIKSEEGGSVPWGLYLTAFYTDSLMDVEIGDDLLYIRRENGEVTKLEDNEYHFTEVGIPVFYTYNKYSEKEGEPLIGYEWELQVRYQGTNEYITYKTGITNEGQNFKIEYNSYTLNDYVKFENTNIVGVKLIIKNLDNTLYNADTSIIVNTNIHTQDCGSGYESLYNFCYFQIYHKDEEGVRTLVNEETLDSSYVYKRLPTLKIAEYDQATYGTYLQRSYDDVYINNGHFYLEGDKWSSDLLNNVAEEKYTYGYELGNNFDLYYYEVNKDTIIKTYDILPEGMYLEYSEEEIINNIDLRDNFAGTENLKLKDGTTFASKKDLENYIKEHTEVEIDYNYQDSGRTKIIITTNLNEIDWSYYLTNYLIGMYFGVRYNIEVEIPYESILEYGTSYTNYVYSMWNNQEYDYSYNQTIDNGKYDSLASDIDQDGDIEESITYDYVTLNITHAVSSQQAVIKQVRTDLTQGQYVEGTAEVSSGGEYDYKLRVTTGANSIKDLILYDSIETITDESGVDVSEGWKGSFLGVDTSYAESKGYAPKVYYSTELNPGKLTEVPDKWQLLDDNVDKSTVKSICVDLRYNADGGEMELTPNNVVFVLVKMQAPDDKTLVASANNMFWTNWRAIDPLGSVIDNVEGIYSNQVNVEIYKLDVVKEISGRKIWEDNENALGLRPASIVVKLMQDGTEYARKEVSEADNWNYTFENVPVYRDNAGNEFVYTIEEETVTDYVKEISGNDITNKVDKTEIEVEKKWVGDEESSRRPEKVTIQLKKGGVLLEEKEANESNNWKVTFINLDKYDDNGTEIVYTVDEKEDLEFYTKAVVGNVITNTFTVPDDKIQITGIKSWNDNNNEAGKRPTSITLQVKNGESVVAEQEVSEQTNWQYTFELPKYDSLGNEISYTVDEKDSGSKFYVKEKVEGNTVTNKFEVPNETVEVTVEKKWNDNENEAQKRPSSVTLQVKEGEKIVQEQVVTETENWKHTFTNLPKYDSLGNEINYTVDEKESFEFYTKGIVGNIITNIFRVPDDTIKIVGQKEWQDNENEAGKRPTSVILQVKANGAVVTEAEVNKNNLWRYEFTVPKYDEYGNEVEYTIDEREIGNKFYEKVGVEENVVINKFVVPDEKVQIKVQKSWDDNHNEAGKRPTSITLQVKNGENVAAEYEISETTNWEYTFELPKYDNLGNEISYTVDETFESEFYIKNIVGNVITNKFVVPEDRITIVGTKEWNDNDNLAGKRPESVILQIKNGETVVAEAEVSEKTNWTYAFDLAKYDSLGNEINYTLSERMDSIFYEKETVENVDMFNQKIVNKFVVPNEQILIKAVKKWEDNNDEYGKRPNSVVLQVLSGDEVVAEQKVTETDSWSYSFKLPKYDELGNEIEYTVDEKETARNYEKHIEGNTVVNTCIYVPPVNTSDISVWVYVVILVVAIVGISGVLIVKNKQKKSEKKV